jgi:hypothetical protein
MKFHVFLVILICCSFQTTTIAGNESGGGGNIQPRKMKVNDFDDFFSTPYDGIDASTLKSNLIYAFQGLERQAWLSPGLTPEILTKLFGSNTARGPIYRIINKMSVVNAKDKACVDPLTGEDADGSAHLATMSICLSTYRLSKKLYAGQAFIPFINLAMHEAAHLAGLEEKDMKDINVVADETGLGFQPTFNNMVLQLDNIIGSGFKLEVIAADSDSKNLEVCREIDLMKESVQTFLNAMASLDRQRLSYFNKKTSTQLLNKISYEDFIYSAELCLNFPANRISLIALGKKYKDISQIVYSDKDYPFQK